MSIITTPGLLTCEQEHDYPRLRAHGYEWITFQAWNRGARLPLRDGTPQLPDYDLAPARAAGLSPGVWGVIYEDEDSLRFEIAGQFAARARALGADHLMFDIEYTTDAFRVYEGARAGGWTGPIHLTCLGAPDERAIQPPRFWDYGYDLQPFLDTGGGIFPQAYYNQHAGYRPDLCVAYYCDQLGVPRDRVNLMIWPNGTVAASDWVVMLRKAGLGRAVSIFLAESTSDGDLTTLEQVTMPMPPPTPPPKPTRSDLEALRVQAVSVLKQAEAMQDALGFTQAQKNNSRIVPARRYLELAQDASFPAVRDKVKAALGIAP